MGIEKVTLITSIDSIETRYERFTIFEYPSMYD